MQKSNDDPKVQYPKKGTGIINMWQLYDIENRSEPNLVKKQKTFFYLNLIFDCLSMAAI